MFEFLGVLIRISLELSFCGLIIATIYILYQIWLKNSKVERFFLFVLAATFLFLVNKFSFFAPINVEDHSVELISNIYKNYLIHDFLAIEHSYLASAGFYEYFCNKILWFLPQFNVYYIYYINVTLSLLSGLVLYYLTLIWFNKKKLSFLAITIYYFFPIVIKLAATETFMVMTTYTLLVFITFLILLYKDFSREWLIFIFFSFLSIVLGRIDHITPIVLGLCFIYIPIILQNKKLRKLVFGDWLSYVVMLLSAVYLLLVFFITINSSVNIRGEGYFSFFEVKYLTSIFLSHLYFFNQPVQPHFLKIFFTPVYYFIFLKLSLLLFIKEWFYDKNKNYLVLFILAFFLLSMRLIMDDNSLNNLRRNLPLFPILSILVAYVAYEITFRKRIYFIIMVAFIFVSVFFHLPFLETKTLRRNEQDFLIKHIKNIPDNSIIVTIAEKKYDEKYLNSRFKYSPYTVHGFEFPSYLLVGRKIDIMDFYYEYDEDILSKYDNIYYYRSPYAFHENIVPLRIKEFEAQHDLELIEKIDVLNVGILTGSVDRFVKGFHASVRSNDSILELGLYKFKLKN